MLIQQNINNTCARIPGNLPLQDLEVSRPQILQRDSDEGVVSPGQVRQKLYRANGAIDQSDGNFARLCYSATEMR